MIRKKRITSNRAMKRTVNSSPTTKQKELLSLIERKLEKIGLNYGPVVYDELQSRLEQAVDIFNKDLDSLFSELFPTYTSKNKNTKVKKGGETGGKTQTKVCKVCKVSKIVIVIILTSSSGYPPNQLQYFVLVV